MPTWGIQATGFYYRQTEDDPIVKGYVYEEIRKYDSNIPPEKYFELIKQLREHIDASEYGLKTRYIEVNQNWIRVQFEKTGSPLITWKIVVGIIVAAISVALAAWAASLLVHELYKLSTVLGPENISMILNIMMIGLMLMMFSPMMSMIREMTTAFRRRE